MRHLIHFPIKHLCGTPANFAAVTHERWDVELARPVSCQNQKCLFGLLFFGCSAYKAHLHIYVIIVDICFCFRMEATVSSQSCMSTEEPWKYVLKMSVRRPKKLCKNIYSECCQKENGFLLKNLKRFVHMYTAN